MAGNLQDPGKEQISQRQCLAEQIYGLSPELSPRFEETWKEVSGSSDIESYQPQRRCKINNLQLQHYVCSAGRRN